MSVFCQLYVSNSRARYERKLKQAEKAGKHHKAKKYAEKLERPRAEAAGAASDAWVLGDSLARLRDAMLPRLTRVSLAGADRLPVAMLRVAFPLDGDGLAAPAPYDDGSGSLTVHEMIVRSARPPIVMWPSHGQTVGG